jgi:hypothetical protein
MGAFETDPDDDQPAIDPMTGEPIFPDGSPL